MNNLQQMKVTLEKYIADHGFSTEIEDTIMNLSYNNNEKNYLCSSEIKAIDMDNIARKCYRKIYDPLSETENDSIKSVDCFLINSNNQWFFIEFKDTQINNSTRRQISLKAYANVFELLDILFSTKNDEEAYSQFDYGNPIAFFQHNVNYILVFSSQKNSREVMQEKNHMLKNEMYSPEYMKKLKGYLFDNVWAMSDFYFENIFLKKFNIY